MKPLLENSAKDASLNEYMNATKYVNLNYENKSENKNRISHPGARAGVRSGMPGLEMPNHIANFHLLVDRNDGVTYFALNMNPVNHQYRSLKSNDGTKLSNEIVVIHFFRASHTDVCLAQLPPH